MCNFFNNGPNIFKLIVRIRIYHTLISQTDYRKFFIFFIRTKVITIFVLKISILEIVGQGRQLWLLEMVGQSR